MSTENERLDRIERLLEKLIRWAAIWSANPEYARTLLQELMGGTEPPQPI